MFDSSIEDYHVAFAAQDAADSSQEDDDLDQCSSEGIEKFLPDQITTGSVSAHAAVAQKIRSRGAISCCVADTSSHHHKGKQTALQNSGDASINVNILLQQENLHHAEDQEQFHQQQEQQEQYHQHSTPTSPPPTATASPHLAAATWPLKSRVSRTDQAAGSSNYSSRRNDNNNLMMFMMMSKMLQAKTSADIISNPVLNSFQVCTTSASSSSELHHHVQHHHPMSHDIAFEPVFELFECFV
jgi:hypothetical protein